MYIRCCVLSVRRWIGFINIIRIQGIKFTHTGLNMKSTLENADSFSCTVRRCQTFERRAENERRHCETKSRTLNTITQILMSPTFSNTSLHTDVSGFIK